MERVENQPTDPGTDDLGDDVHHATNDGHTTRSHHASGDDRVEAGARKGVNPYKDSDHGKGISSDAR